MRVAQLVLVGLLCYLIRSEVSTGQVDHDESSLILIVRNERRCLSLESAHRWDRVRIHLQVLVGENNFGFTVEGPESSLLYDNSAEFSYEMNVYFLTQHAGEHRICVDNTGHGHSEKVIKILVGLLSRPDSLKLRSNPFALSLMRVDQALIDLTEDQVYLHGREADHRVTIESNTTRLALRSILEAMIIIGIGLGQVYYLQKLFKRKAQRAA